MDNNTPAAASGEPKPLNRMNLDELMAEAARLGVHVPENATKAEIRKSIESRPAEGSEVDGPGLKPTEVAPLSVTMDEFQELMTKRDAVLPTALTEEQYQWLSSLNADLDMFTKRDDGTWSRGIQDETPAQTVDHAASQLPPVPQFSTDPAAASGEPKQVQIAIEEDLPAPLDVTLEAFIEMMTSGTSPVPSAITEEQRSWLAGNTAFNNEQWKLHSDDVWRCEIQERDPAPFSLDEIEASLDPRLVESAVKGWYLTGPIDGAVHACSADGWRVATVNEDGSSVIEFLANIPRHDRASGYVDSHDVRLSVESIDHLILTLIGLRTAAAEALGLED